jgi:predicted metal-dependent hydrolase
MNEIPYTIVRSARRKTVGIGIAPDNRVTVRVPLRFDERKIAGIVEEHSPLILKRMARNSERSARIGAREYADGEKFLFLGKSYLLERVKGCNGVVLMDDRLCVGAPRAEDGDSGRIASRIARWYRAHALGIFIERVNRYRESLGVVPQAVKIKKLRSRWGSCSTRGNLNFNWLLVLAPIEVVDYVVVHELCHFIHPDHSAGFWKLVESVLPDYRARRKWLKTEGFTLTMDGNSEGR